jgi:hypothetical protein
VTALLVEGAGWLGAAVLLVAYGLVTTGRLSGRGAGFQLLNLAGAAGLLANGAFHGAWPSAALNGVWMAIGVVAVARLRRGGRTLRGTDVPAAG